MHELAFMFKTTSCNANIEGNLSLFDKNVNKHCLPCYKPILLPLFLELIS